MDNKIGRNSPCLCGSGKKYKKCCLIKDTVANMSYPSQKLSPPTINCYDCGKEIDHNTMSSFSISGANASEKIYFCTTCYRDMTCSICKRQLGLESFSIFKCPDCGEVIIECRNCITNRLRAKKNIPLRQKIRVTGLKRRSRILINASFIEK